MHATGICCWLLVVRSWLSDSTGVVWTVKRLVERNGDVVLVEWEGFVDPGSYTWESVFNLQNDLGIDVLTDFLDQVEVEGARDLQEVQGVQEEVTADVAEGDGAPRRSNRLRVRTLARKGSLEFPPTNFPVQPLPRKENVRCIGRQCRLLVCRESDAIRRTWSSVVRSLVDGKYNQQSWVLHAVYWLYLHLLSLWILEKMK